MKCKYRCVRAEKSENIATYTQKIFPSVHSDIISLYIYTFILPLGTPKILYITAGYKTPSIIPLGTKIPLGTNQFFSKLF